eukprot:GHVU01214513.1.p1 GENE.GHVU01214513.1~~GHVU01214513.1.p1  ORF type:complete len:205 (+),score=33.25 GHVU01214513.1:1235-1849(+)
MQPIKLPLGTSFKSEVKDEKKVKMEVKVKSEAMDTDSPDGEEAAKPDVVDSSKTSRAKTCAELFTSPDTSEIGELLFLQLPDVLPGVVYKADLPAPGSSRDANPPAAANKEENKEDELATRLGLTSLSDFSEGYVGKLQVHKSGRTKLVLGGVALDVTMGTPPSFLQDLVSIRVMENTGDMTVLGHIKHKLVCVPDMDSLLEDR